jgi:hypothetical protein
MVQEKCAVLVHDSSDIIDGPRKACLVPKSIAIGTVSFFEGGMQCHIQGLEDVPLSCSFPIRLCPDESWESQDNIAFLAAVLEMESGESHWCLLCAMGAKYFTCNWEDCMSKERTMCNRCKQLSAAMLA